MNLVWFRSDLRVNDNAALHAAQQHGEPVIGVYFATPGQWLAHDLGPNKVDFLLRNVSALRESLAQLGIPLIFREIDTYAGITPALSELVQALSVQAVHANEEYGFNERVRDKAVAEQLQAQGARFYRYCDFVLQRPGTVKTGQGEFFKVYTPFKRAWLRSAPGVIPEYTVSAQAWPVSAVALGDIPTSLAGFESARGAGHWPAGESAAKRSLQAFAAERMADYHARRDMPAEEGTSGVSPYLAAGVLSCRDCFRLALVHGGGWDSASAGAAGWVNELIWREFYTHVLVGFSRVSRGRAFVEATEKIPWLNRPQDFQVWCEGLTGVPIVDAAMRQLRETGWMHNRLRMIVAQFLSKHLLVDWRWGERFFMQHLVDADLAANNGGWQWSASTGTDAAPYFRVFNPVEQSKRFDPSGVFIRRYLPELAEVSTKDIHLPPPGVATRLGYPLPIVDIKYARQRAIATFAEVMSRSSK